MIKLIETDEAKRKEIEMRMKWMEKEYKESCWYQQRGFLHQSLGNDIEAIDDFNKAIGLQHGESYVSRSMLKELYLARADHYFFKIQKYEEAIKDYAKVIELCQKLKSFDEEMNKSIGSYNEYNVYYEAYYYPTNDSLDIADHTELLSDFSQAIALAPENSDMFIKRGIIYFRTVNYVLAISDFEKAINLNSPHSDFIKQLLSISYYNHAEKFYEDNSKKAINFYAKAINLDPDNAELYHKRADHYSKLNNFDMGFQDFSKAIKLSPIPAYYMMLASFCENIDECYKDEAEKIYSDAFERFPECRDGCLYRDRCEFYIRNGNYEKALQDFKEYVKKMLSMQFHSDRLNNMLFHWKMKDIKENKIEFYDLGDKKASGSESHFKKVFYDKFERAFYDVLIDQYSEQHEAYIYRGMYFMEKNEYNHAINDFNRYFDKSIQLKTGDSNDDDSNDDLFACFFRGRVATGDSNDDSLVYFLRGLCYDKINQEDKAHQDFDGFIAKNDFSALQYQRTHYPLLFDKLNYRSLLIYIAEKLSVGNMLGIFNFFIKGIITDYVLFLGRILDKYSGCESTDKLFSEYSEWEKSIFNRTFDEIFPAYYPNYKTSLEYVFNRDDKDDFLFFTKISFLKFLFSNIWKTEENFSTLSIKVDLKRDPNKKLESNRSESESESEKIRDIDRISFLSALSYLEGEREGKRIEREVAQARVDERNKVIADLSHSIKNLISTIIDPLNNLKKAKEVKPAIIDDALKGANLIRQIVNAMTLSFKGSIEDFYYDARNIDKDRTDLQSAFVESLISSVGNMFDGKYFPDFQTEYFASEDIIEKAESEWTGISQSKNLQKITAFLGKYFFDCDFSFDKAADYAIGNEKGSAVKLLILFQELIQNAVKYSAFVSRENRRLRIVFNNDTPEQIIVRIENRYNDRINVSTSGIGHVIVENFCKLMETEPVVTKENGIYAVEIRFANFWKETDK